MTLDELMDIKEQWETPYTVTHIGSASKCQRRFEEMNLRDTLSFKRVWSIGCNTHNDEQLKALGYSVNKTILDVLHLYKIDDSDEVLVLDITDEGFMYIGESASRELAYAKSLGMRIRYYSEEIPITERPIYRKE